MSIGLITLSNDIHVLLSNTSSISVNQNGVVETLQVYIEKTKLIYPFQIGTADSGQWCIATEISTNQNSSRGEVRLNHYDGSSLTFVQSFSTVGLSHITSFKSDNDDYLVLSNNRDQSGTYSTYQVSVDIYRRKSHASQFEFFQKIPAYRAVDASVTQFGTQVLLAITHYEQSVSVYRLETEIQC